MCVRVKPCHDRRLPRCVSIPCEEECEVACQSSLCDASYFFLRRIYTRNLNCRSQPVDAFSPAARPFCKVTLISPFTSTRQSRRSNCLCFASAAPTSADGLLLSQTVYAQGPSICYFAFCPTLCRNPYTA